MLLAAFNPATSPVAALPNIPFRADDLSGEEKVRSPSVLHGRLKKFGRINVGVPVHHAVAHEFRLLQARNHPQDSFLLSPLQISLEAHDIVESARQVILS